MNRRNLLRNLAAVTTTGAAASVFNRSGVAVAQDAAGEAPPASGPGRRNLITDVAGLAVGQADDADVRTGVTVILPDVAAVAACDVRGGGPASRETDVLMAENLVQKVDGIVLSGGSVYGLGAADGVAAWMGARDRGFTFRPRPGVPPSPILPAACLYDLGNGGNKDWGTEPPYRSLGIEAVGAATEEVMLGTAGAGFGANAGGLKGGIGSASAVSRDGMTVGAIVAVNSMGSAVAPNSRQFWAAPVEQGAEFGGLGTDELRAAPEDYGRAMRPRENTTIACVATDVALTRVELKRIAVMAQDGMGRALRPSHSPFDGDIVFTLSTAKQKIPDDMPRQFAVTRLGALAADVLARAIARGVYEATAFSDSGIPAWRDT